MRKLFGCLGECLTADVCTAEYDSKKGVTSYTIEGKEATSEEFQAYLAKLNSDYDELSVTISTMGENKVPNNEGTLAESYDEYKLGDVVGGASFTYVEKKNTSMIFLTLTKQQALRLQRIIIPIRQQIRQQVRRQALQPQ